MADQPARALIVYGDGLMRSVEPRHTHLHALAAAGSCGFLALRSQVNERHRSGDDTKRAVGELAQLLDIHDIYQKKAADFTSDGNIVGDEQIPPMSERFMDMKAGMFSNSGPAAAVGQQAGFSMLELQEGSGDIIVNDNAFPKPSKTADRLLTLLGLDENGANNKQPSFELLLLHLSAGQQDTTEKKNICHRHVDWVDELVGVLQALTEPGTKAGSHLYLVLVLGYGPIDFQHRDTLKDDGLPLVTSNDHLPPALAQLVPQQSYTMKGGRPVADIREHHPLLVVYHLNAVTRRDEVQALSYHEFQNHCGNLTILVDRLLHEVAFKLWKAPKYGA